MKLLPLILASAVFLGTSQDIDSLQSKYGISIERSWSGYVVSTFVHDKYRPIAVAPLSTTPNDFDKQLQKLQEDKLTSLEKDYAVHIGKSGTTYESAYGQLHTTAIAVPVRAPKLGELFILEYALKHSKPSQLIGLSQRSKGINVYFLADKKNLTLSEWGFDTKGKPSIFVEQRTGITFGHTLEENLMHQLSHNSEYRMGWNPFESWLWPMSKKLGWVVGGGPMSSVNYYHGQMGNYSVNVENLSGPIASPASWLLQTNEGPNYLYRQSGPEIWTRCDKNLQALDDNGKAVVVSHARTLSSERIREFALVTPVSTDFSTPPEVFADGLAMFRADKNSRAELLEESPRLYGLVKDHDQKELDATYGKGLKVRSVDGTVADPSPAVLRDIRELEQGTPS